MNLRSVLYAIRKFGIKGIYEYVVRQPRQYAFRRFLERTLRRESPEAGITLITCFDYPGSLSKAMRDFAMTLKRAGIPYQTLNTPCDNPIPECEFASILTPVEDFCLNKYTHIITMKDPIRIPDNRCKVCCVEFWEFEDGFLESCPEALRAQNVLALSDFNRDVFRKQLPVSIGVSKILYPFQFLHGELDSIEDTRKRYGVGADDFVVFFNFDYASSYFRKNPEGVLHAFAIALSDKADAKLLFKTMRAAKCKEMSNRLHSLADELGLSEKLITIDDFIPQEELVNITNACDVYISLHRGEGFGLGIAEAMSLGKAVVVTDYSATTEFCNLENSIPIPNKIVKVPPDQIDNDAYKYVTSWAEPEIDVAAAALRKLYNDSALRHELGKRAKVFVDEYFSIARFKRSLEELLKGG